MTSDSTVFSVGRVRIPRALDTFSVAPSYGKWLSDLSRLNVLIGPNNQGKSRLLRALFVELAEEDNLEPATELGGPLIEALNGAFRRISERLPTAKSSPRVASREPDPYAEKAIAKLQRISFGDDQDLIATALSGRLEDLLETASTIHESYRALGNHKPENRPYQEAITKIVEASGFLHAELEELQSHLPDLPSIRRIYIPSLRGARKVGEGDTYRDRTLRDYFSNAGSELEKKVFQTLSGEHHTTPASYPAVEIFTGLSTYELVKAHLLGTLQERNLVQEFETFLGETFFEGQPVALIPRESDKNLYAKIGREAEQPIHSLGDGIQQLIIQTMPVFLRANDDLLLFIEEPELFLHPGYQRSLIKVLLKGTRSTTSLQSFVATHSHQFLDLTLDPHGISVFRVSKRLPPGDAPEKVGVFSVERVSKQGAQVLEELGVHNSSVLLSNCTLWVEGVTDRMYLRKMLQLVGGSAKFQEDLHYSFVEYSGSNITHWSFLDENDGIAVEALCGRLLLIADRDENREARHKELKDKLGDRYYPLPCREIENLLSPAVLRSVISEYEGEDVEFPPFDQDSYSLVPLGRFIEESILNGRRRRTGSYAARSGTVRDKLSFATRAVRAMQTPDDLSPEGRRLAETALEFIKKHNT